ncbi:hypothetical protein JVU11DRAFT_1664 [Chiua virens]|nr:hypothetical protein JVU11DRAFT_1664 [Chiua virens]
MAQVGQETERHLNARFRHWNSTIMDLRAVSPPSAEPHDIGVIKIVSFEESEVKRDAEELRDVRDEASPTRQTADLGDSAIRLLRCVCDTIDMNTLAEEEHFTCTTREYNLNLDLACPADTHSVLDVSISCAMRSMEQVTMGQSDVLIAEQSWDLLLDISQQWTKMDVSEMDISEGNDDEGSFIHDGSGAAIESARIPENVEEAVDLDSENSAASPSPNNPESAAYKSLPSPLKRKRLKQLAARRELRRWLREYVDNNAE